PRTMQAALQQAAKAQDAAREAQRQAIAAQSKIAETRAKLQQSPDTKSFANSIRAQQEIASAQTRALAAQSQAVAAQQEAVRNAQFAGQPFAAAKAALDEAARKQSEAQEAQKAANEMLTLLAQQLKDERDAQWKRWQAQKAATASQQKALQLQQRADAAFKQNSTPETQKKADALKREADAAREEEQRAREALEREQVDAHDKAQGADALQKEAAEAQNNAAQKQSEAQASQTEANTLATQALAAAKTTAPAGASPAAQQPSTQRMTNSSTSRAASSGDSKTQDIGQLFDTATTTEKEIAELDRQIRAANLALATRTPFEEALSQTESAAPLRQPLDRDALNSPPGDAARRAQVAQARSQIRSMVISGRQMLARAGGRPAGVRGTREAHGSREARGSARATAPSTRSGAARGAPAAIVGSSTDAVRDAQMMPLAQQDATQFAKDLTGVMKGQNAQGGSTPPLRPGSGSGGAAADAVYGPRSTNESFALSPVVPEFVAGDVAEKAIPGRRILKGGQGADWMFVDSWYVLGPFANPNRSNINRRFAPEAVLDLDATYAGKDNRPVRWRFLQSGNPMVVPENAEEYGVYYAYTELWFDEPRDLWIAIGSDDKSTVWLNEQLVWVSSDQLKGWQLGEGLRRVHFKKGLNRVLYRVENGWRGMAFSLVVCLKPNP
ncbi:MAG TPA: hypothetical protein VF600_16635, partial [Abditibacteriaceae bacterium]